MNYNNIFTIVHMLIYMIDYSNTVKYDTIKYDTMKVVQYNIKKYEVRCDDMMSVHLHIYYNIKLLTGTI